MYKESRAEEMFKKLGCSCATDEFLGDILAFDPDCKYHNWLDDAVADGEDID